MRRAVFVDTAAWLALVNKSDTLHLQSKKVRDGLQKQKTGLLTTDYVLVELANALSRIPFRETAVNLINSILSANDIEIVEIDRDIYQEAWNLYSSRMDKEWGLTDCTSFVAMSRRNIIEAFTSDRHFEQAGFIILLKE